MAAIWIWKAIDPRGKWTLPLLIQQLNLRFNKLQAQLAPLFSSVASVNTFAGAATTPSIYGSKTWRTNNSVPTTITNFMDGQPGDERTIWSGDANTTIANNANIRTKSGANIVMTATDVRTFATIDGLLWRET